jgi:lysophospholipase L1-like esterase
MFWPTRFIPLLSSLALLGCSKPAATPAPTAPESSLRYLALGDSYTSGESVDESERYPVQLAGLLRKQGIALADPVIVARTGWTTDELSAGIDQAKPEGTFDLVTLLIGVNNQYRGRSEAEYRGQFAQLLNRAIGFAGNRPRRVIVISIPDWGVMPFAEGQDRAAIAAAIDRFNAINRQESATAGVGYVDITSISRQANQNVQFIAPDGLHPAGPQYAQWSQAILPLAQDALASK